MPQVDLSRTVRFFVDPMLSDELIRAQLEAKPHNSFAGFPPAPDDRPGFYFEFDVRCHGEVDPDTGYFLNIKDIDAAFRRTLIVAIARICRIESEGPDDGRPSGGPAVRRPAHECLPRLLRMLNDALIDVRRSGRQLAPVASTRETSDDEPTIVRGLTWRLSPYLRVEAKMSETNDIRVFIRQQFDFCASHRLHAPGLSDEENRRIFGKCNLPNGHGHNYRLEPCVEMPTVSDASAGPDRIGFRLSDLERMTSETIIDRFDHKHLNIDTPEFDVTRGGVNPSVENIAVVCFNLLRPRITSLAAEGKHATLRSVTVWETEKTSATFPSL